MPGCSASSNATRKACLEELRTLQTELQRLQGGPPLILPSVDG